MLKFDRKYFILALLIFIIEILIAIFVHDNFVRPYFGDFLVVILMYCFVKSFFNLSVLKVAIFVLLFSFCVEFLQHLNLIEVLGLGKSKIAKTIIGNSFSWIDMLTYMVGIFCVILFETLLNKRKIN